MVVAQVWRQVVVEGEEGGGGGHGVVQHIVHGGDRGRGAVVEHLQE